ncbi:uncharacterized protein LOC127729597 [Mytilus californianus]|uniref:uncharacterized protein LOC127729597 n=1 Tax=Mytilus californianus TaxID=6549 RepID=UPI002246F52F|nr:uncharacterized protein LOC127729597 [Mytilus californianus]
MEDMEEERKLFAIFDWVDGYSVQTLTAIVKPRKDVGDYEKGERVQAKCYGHPGLHWGTLAAIDGDKIWLNQKAKGTRPIIDERTNNDGKDTSAEQKDESRNEISNTKKRKINKRIEFEGEKDLSSSEEEKVEEEADEDMVVILPPKKKGKTVKMIDEGKKAKAEASKKKREVNNERKKVAEKLSKVILDTPDTKTCSCNPETIQRIENKLDQVLCLVESLAECKYCLKKAYKVHAH